MIEKIYCLFMSLLFSSLVSASNQKNFYITTWNLRHMMSQSIFEEWRSFCEPLEWDESNVRPGQKPKHLTYCNAHNGLSFPDNEKESLPLTSYEDFSKKVSALSILANELKSDIYLFQEVSDAQAVKDVVGKNYAVYITTAQIPLNLAVAVQKRHKKNVSSVTELPSFAVSDDKGRLVRPAQELNITLNGVRFSILNVHLKSGCKNYIISDPDTSHARDEGHKNSIINGCNTLRKQVPALEEWIESKAKNDEHFVIGGDFNRQFIKDLSMDARLDGSDPKSEIEEETKIGSLLKEVSDDEPANAYLHIIKSEDASKGLTCHEELDHFLAGKKAYSLLKESRSSPVSIRVSYYKSNYGLDKALPSDHCPITYRMRIK